MTRGAPNRGRRIRLASAPPLLLLPLLSLPAHAGSRTVYERVRPAEVRSGVVSVRVAPEAVVEVPAACEAGPLACTETVRFSSVYGIDFRLEHQAFREGETRTTEEERGRVLLAVNFGVREERALDELLRRVLARLGAGAFESRFAGLGPGALLFNEVASRSVEPSWACFEHGAKREAVRYARTAPPDDKNPDQISRGFTQYATAPEPLCESMAAAVRLAAPDEVRTMPVPQVLRTESVRVSFTDRLPREARTAELARLPAGATSTVRPAPPGGNFATSTIDQERGIYTATTTKDRLQHQSVAGPVELPPALATGAGWFARWIVETVEQKLGPLPVEETLEREHLLLALIPTMPPERLDEQGEALAASADEVHKIEFDEQVFLEAVAGRLDRASSLDAATVENASAWQPAGLESPGWILVACSPDGSAGYVLPPGPARSRVLNAAPFCAALDAQID